jgi:hypothetical protein
MPGWERCGFHKKHVETHYAEHAFLHPVGSADHVIHFGAFEARNVDTLFIVLGWAWCGFHKKCVGTHGAELVFLHLVGSVSHLVHSGAFGVRNIKTLLFMPRWKRCDFHKKRVGTYHAKFVFLYPVESVGHVVHQSHEISMQYFSFSSGPGAVSIKNASGHVTPNFCFGIWWDLWVT